MSQSFYCHLSYCLFVFLMLCLHNHMQYLIFWLIILLARWTWGKKRVYIYRHHLQYHAWLCKEFILLNLTFFSRVFSSFMCVNCLYPLLLGPSLQILTWTMKGLMWRPLNVWWWGTMLWAKRGWSVPVHVTPLLRNTSYSPRMCPPSGPLTSIESVKRSGLLSFRSWHLHKISIVTHKSHYCACFWRFWSAPEM